MQTQTLSYKMEYFNTFLGPKPPHNRVMEGCFCTDCRMLRSEELRTYNNGQLYHLFKTTLPEQEHKKLMILHETVLKQIVAGKEYHDNCLAGSGLQQFKSWANRMIRRIPITSLQLGIQTT